MMLLDLLFRHIELLNRIISVIVILIAAISGVKGFYKWGSDKDVVVWRQNCIKYVIPIILFLMGTALRLYRFPEIPHGLSQDGVMTALDAKALADYGTDRFGTKLPAHLQGWTYGQQSALLAYLTVPFIKLLGLNLLSMRLPLMILSLLGMIIVYYVTKAFMGDIGGCIGLLLIALNPWHFMQSRWAIDCNVFPHVFFAGFCILVLGVCKNKKSYIYGSMLLFGLSMYGYGVSFFFVPFFLILACVALFLKRVIKAKDIVACVLIYLMVCWPEYMVMIINYLKLPSIYLPFVTIQYFPESVRSNDLLIFSDGFVDQLKENLVYAFDVLTLQRNQDSWDVFKEFGTSFKFSLVFVGIGVIVSAIRAKRKCFEGSLHDSLDSTKNDGCIRAAYSLILCYFFAGVLLCLLVNGINVPRANVIPYLYVVLCAIGVDYVISFVKSARIIVPILYVFFFLLFIDAYYSQNYERISAYMFCDFAKSLEAARDVGARRYYITPDTQYQGSKNVSEIITMFVFDVDSHYWRDTGTELAECETPYLERFIYENVDENSIDSNAAYVFNVTEHGDIFRKLSDYTVMIYGNYGVAYKKGTY